MFISMEKMIHNAESVKSGGPTLSCDGSYASLGVNPLMCRGRASLFTPESDS